MTDINESTIYELVGQTVKLFCIITFNGFPDVLVNLTVDWYQDSNIINTTTVFDSVVHTLVLDIVSVSSGGVYTCAVSNFSPGREVQLNVFPS